MLPVSNSICTSHLGTQPSLHAKRSTKVETGHLNLKYSITPALPGQDFLKRYAPTDGEPSQTVDQPQ